MHFGYVYDAMWTIALALNSSISILEDRGLGRLEDFTYDSVEMADVFTEAVANVSFEGISVSYDLPHSNMFDNHFHAGKCIISAKWKQNQSLSSNATVQRYMRACY